MAEGRNPYEIELLLSANTGEVVQGFTDVASVIQQMRTDIEAIDNATDSISDRADKMRSFWSQNLEAVQSIATVMREISTLTQTNQTSFANNIQALNEMMNSVRGLGGNMGNVTSMLGIAGGGRSAAGGYGTYPTEGPSFSQSRGFTKAEINNNFGDYIRSQGRVSGGTAPYTPAPNMGDITGEYSDASIPINLRRKPRKTLRPDEQLILNQLDDYPALKSRLEKQGALGPDQLTNVATKAYDSFSNDLSTITNALPLGMGKTLSKRIIGAIGGYGINPASIAASQKAGTEVVGTNPATGESIYGRPQGITPGVETSALHLANTVAKIVDSKFASNMSKAAGYASIAGNTLGAVQDFAAAARPYTSMSQTQGGAFGTVDFSRSVGMGLQAYLHTGLNTNPNYSSQQYLQAMTNGASLGLRGSQLEQYARTAMTYQTNYGMSAGATMGMIDTGLGYGVSMQDNANAFRGVRNMEAQTNTSVAYGDQAYQLGMATGASQGLGSAAAGAYGATTAQFGAGNFVIQGAGFTGTEGAGSMLTNALMAQKLGVSYMGLYAATRKMKGDQYAKALNASQEQILGWAGIDTKRKYKDENDFQKHNANKIIELQLILQSLVQQGSTGYSGPASSPQKAAAWAWGIVQQHQKLNQKSDSFLQHIGADIVSFGKRVATDVGHAARNVIDAPGSEISKVVHGVNDVGGFVAGAIKGQTTDQIIAGNNQRNREFDRGPAGLALQPGKLASSMLDRAVKNYNPIQDWRRLVEHQGQTPNTTHVTIGIQPHWGQKLTASVANGTSGFNNGHVSPNRQPSANSNQ